MKKQFLLFDFDGVIADSFELAFEVSRMTNPNLTKDEYGVRFEGNINDWEEPKVSDDVKPKNYVNFFVEYFSRMKNEVKLISGIKKVIIKLEKNYTLVVISSTITSPIQEFLEREGLADHFDKILGNDIHKSKVEKIKMVFERYGAAPDDCVFITDTLGDMREASLSDVGSIGVSWGFNKKEVLQRGSPFRIVDEPNELITAISDYFKK
jgi:phosphoglycolate phosphatase-like HAD superfamily hydrolase